MKAKLIKHKFGYNLVDTNGEFIATSKDEYSNGINLKYWLSKENCDEIFGVVSPEVMMKDIESNCDKTKEGYIIGFQMAMELNKDKVFTLENFIDLYIEETGYGMDMWGKEENEVMTTIAKIIQPLQQPTEIDVEIVTLIDYFDSSNKLYLSTDEAAKYCTDTGIPYTDSEGNLILKKL
jgi:hypothetical protein